MSLSAYEDFFYAACLALDDDPVTAWERQSEQVSGSRTGCRARRRFTSGGRARTSRSRRGTQLDPARGQAQHARRRVLHRAGGGLGRTARSVLVPGGYGGRGCGRAAALRGRQGRRRQAEQGEEFLIEMLDTDDGARRLGELGIGTNYGIYRSPRRSCSTRRSAAPSTWRSAPYPESGGTNELRRALGHGLRPAPRRLISVDGEELQRDGKFLV